MIIDVLQNETLDMAEALYFLPASKEVEEKFNVHFDNGIEIAESVEQAEWKTVLERT